jgi:predicted ATPase/DNA-binding SARP family transcriptional activator
MSQARIGILGTLEVEVGGERVDLSAMQLRRMLAILALSAGRPVSGDTLVEWLWPSEGFDEKRPKDPPATVRIYASRLRRLIPDRLGRSDEGAGYRLEIDRNDLDANLFEDALAAATPLVESEPQRAATMLTEALTLWRGAAIAEFRDESWAVGTAVRLEELRLVALERLADARLALGDEAALCGELEHLVEQHPLRERLWSQLMLALYRSGRQADALRAFQRLRNHLAEELGIAPSPELVEREAAVLRQDPSLDRPVRRVVSHVPTEMVTAPLEIVPPLSAGRQLGAPAPERTTWKEQPAEQEQAPRGLPAQITRFIGRERETAETRALLSGFRLVTLTGPGGVGKTRLAIETAAAMRDHFAGGVVFVELAPHAESDELESAVAEAVGIQTRPGMRLMDALVVALRGFELLLVLDNCEHIVEACAELCGTLLASCPGLRVLATSREPLNVYGETIYRVLPLGLPDAGLEDPDVIESQEAVQLLVDRARMQRANFEVTESNAAAVAELCRKLDGIPLALELAAARLRVLSVKDVLERLEGRFALLVGGRDRMPRQQTLGALIDWSYDLLDGGEQSLLVHLSIFAGSFDVATAENLVALTSGDKSTVLERLVALVDKSLVVGDSFDDTERYHLLETIRQYALDKLAATEGEGAVESVRDAHAAVFLEIAERARPLLESEEQFAAFAKLDRDFDNLRSALAYLSAAPEREHDVMRFVAAMRRYLEWRGHDSEVSSTTDLLADRGALGDLGDPLVLQMRLIRATLVGRHDPERAIASLDEVLDGAKRIADAALIAEVLNRLAWLHWSAGRWDASRKLHAEAVDTARESGLYLPLVLALNGGGATRDERLEALDLSRKAHDALGAYMALCNLGAIAMDEGDGALARAYFEEALPIMERLESVDTDAALLVNLGTALVADGDPVGARPYYERGLRVARLHIDGRQIGYGLLGLAVCASREGEAERAAVLHGAAEEQFRREGFALEDAERRMAEQDLERLAGVLPEETLDAALASGRSLSKLAAIELALRSRMPEASGELGGVAVAGR